MFICDLLSKTKTRRWWTRFFILKKNYDTINVLFSLTQDESVNSGLSDSSCFPCGSLSCAGSYWLSVTHTHGSTNRDTNTLLRVTMKERAKHPKVMLYFKRIDTDNARCHSATSPLHVTARTQATFQNI